MRTLALFVCALAGTLPSSVSARPQARVTPLGTAGGTIVERDDAVPINHVRGRVWLDEDQDGLQDESEPGAAGVTVHLLNGFAVSYGGLQTTTAADGSYAFRGLPDGEYRVSFQRPAGERFTRSLVGGMDRHGAPVAIDTRPDDSDLNLENGRFAPGRRGPLETGMSPFELTRIDANGNPWPINGWFVYPAAPGSGAAPKATVLDLYLGDTVDAANAVATTKLAVSAALGMSASTVTAADPSSTLQDTEARLGAPFAGGGPYPVVLCITGIIGGVADSIEIADHLASHGYVALCMESTSFHASIALGTRLATNGGPWDQSDFDHIPQLPTNLMNQLLAFGYESDGYLMGDYAGDAERAAQHHRGRRRLRAGPGGTLERDPGALPRGRAGPLAGWVGSATRRARATRSSACAPIRAWTCSSTSTPRASSTSPSR